MEAYDRLNKTKAAWGNKNENPHVRRNNIGGEMGFSEGSNWEYTNIWPLGNKTNECNGGELQIFASKCMRSIVGKEEEDGTKEQLKEKQR